MNWDYLFQTSVEKRCQQCILSKCHYSKDFFTHEAQLEGCVCFIEPNCGTFCHETLEIRLKRESLE